MTDNLIEVTVETMDGEVALVKVNLENKVEHLMGRAAKELGIEGDIKLFDLMFEGKRLDPDAKIETTGIRQGSRVRLERRPKVGQ